MTQLVTLAHRVSSIHAKYAAIHDDLFSFSLFRKRPKHQLKGQSLHSHYESELIRLSEELAGISAIMRSGAELEPKTTFSREFAVVLDDYIQALSVSIGHLSEICNHQSHWDKGDQPFDASQSRVDRTHYDESIQHYRRLGARLNQLVMRL
ncbi:MAG: hypothetical protein KDI63_13010 [Gammaproteobacteria bacterium]|nr:hypothetical protein [Gammaproteobacteria bacterium]